MKHTRRRGRPPKNRPAEGFPELWVWLRKKLNKTQKEGILALLEELGKPVGANLKRYQTLISHWERGSRTLSDERLAAVEHVIGGWIEELKQRPLGPGESYRGKYFVEAKGSNLHFINLGLGSADSAVSNFFDRIRMVLCSNPSCGLLTPKAGRYCMHCAAKLTGPRDLNVDFRPPSDIQGSDATGGVESTSSSQQSPSPKENPSEEDSRISDD